MTMLRRWFPLGLPLLLAPTTTTAAFSSSPHLPRRLFDRPSLFLLHTNNHPPSSSSPFTTTTTRVHASSSSSSSSSPSPLNGKSLLSGLFAPSSSYSSLSPPADLLAGTSIDPNRDDVDLVRAYRATRDGWSAMNFHEAVDGRGSAIVIAMSRSGKVFGGYNPLGWMSTDDYGNSNSAFLWFRKGRTSFVKLPILPGGNAAIFDYATSGPNFGASDLCMGPPRAPVMGLFTGPDVADSSSVAGDLRRGKSSVGGAYDYVKGWPVAGEFRLSEVEVWCNANAGKRTSCRGGGGGLFGF